MRLTNAAGVAVMVVGALAACSAGDIVCTLPPVPDAVLAEIRTSSGAPAAFGATLVVQDGAYLESTGPAAGFSGGLVGPDSAQVGAANGRGGEYTVTVIKPYWTSPAAQHASVEGARCGNITSHTLRFTIDPLPEAPPVRSIAIYPSALEFGFCGGGARVSWYVDAAPGVPTTVTWSSSDTTVATVSATGNISDRSKGTARIVATSTVVPSISASIPVRVDPTCP